jgi:hypothetical protein
MTALQDNALSQAQRNSHEFQANNILNQMAHGAGLNEITAGSPYPPEVIAIVQRRIDEAQEARVRAMPDAVKETQE